MQACIRIHPQDNVAVALRDLDAGEAFAQVVSHGGAF